MAAARRGGVLVPEVYEYDAQGIVMERVNGLHMRGDLWRRPWRINRYADLLAELHEKIHAIAAPPSLAERLGPGEALLHLDLQPDNVLISKRGPVVIDWSAAARGDPAADVAQSVLVMETWRGGALRPHRVPVNLAREAFLRRFLSHFEVDAVAAYWPAVIQPSERRCKVCGALRVLRLTDHGHSAWVCYECRKREVVVDRSSAPGQARSTSTNMGDPDSEVRE